MERPTLRKGAKDRATQEGFERAQCAC